MKNGVCILLLVLTSTCGFAAVVGGSVTTTGSVYSAEFDLIGFDPVPFQVSPRPGLGAGVFGGICSPGCAPGESVSLSGILSGLDLLPGPAVINGVSYPSVLFSGANTPGGSAVSFVTAPITFTDATVYTVPFTMSGVLAAYLEDSPAAVCLLCPPGQSTLPISGTGIATIRTHLFAYTPIHTLHDVDSITYEFVPEPGTIFLGTSGLLLMLFRRGGLLRKPKPTQPAS